MLAAERKTGKRHRRGQTAPHRPAAQLSAGAAPQPAGQPRHQQHAQQYAAVLHAGQLRRLPGCHSEYGACEGFQNQVLSAVGEHGDKNEEGESPGLALLPDFPERDAKVGHRGGRLRRGRATLFHAGNRQQGEQHGRGRDGACDGDQASRREGVEKLPGQAGGHGKPGDHHDPHQGGRCRSPFLGDLLGEQHQQGGAAGARPEADQEECDDRQNGAPENGLRHERRCDGGERAAARQYGHAADDPGRSTASAIRPVTDMGSGHLHEVVEGDEKAREHRRQRELDNHDAIDGRRRQHDHGAQRSLYQPEPDNRKPGQAVAHGPILPAASDSAGRELTANAAAIMPST